MQSPAPEVGPTVRHILGELKDRPGALLEALHALQGTFGYVPAEAVAPLAQGLNLSRAEVHGVLTFYHDLRTRPPGRHVLRLCRAESCQAMGAEALAEPARARLGVDFHESTADGRFSLEAVFCLGLCACSPALMLDGRPYGRVTPECLDALLEHADGPPAASR